VPRPGRRTGQIERYHRAWVVRPYRWLAETGEGHERVLRFLVVESTQLAKAKAPRLQRQVWRVCWQVQESPEAITTQAQRERRFVLASNVLDGQQLTDADLLRAYKEQPAVELSCKWVKNPATVPPIFLETPPQIAA
jgi:hypothetical protein